MIHKKHCLQFSFQEINRRLTVVLISGAMQKIIYSLYSFRYFNYKRLPVTLILSNLQKIIYRSDFKLYIYNINFLNE